MPTPAGGQEVTPNSDLPALSGLVNDGPPERARPAAAGEQLLRPFVRGRVGTVWIEQLHAGYGATRFRVVVVAVNPTIAMPVDWLPTPVLGLG